MHRESSGHLLCSACGREYDADEIRWKCTCGNFLDLLYHPELERRKVEGREKTLWRYFETLPVSDTSSIVSFKEGFTPILRSNLFGRDLLVKLEFLFPTGSFKDRGSSVMISKLNELGVKEIVEDSSGNAGASISAYSAKANIKCHIFVPEGAPETKLSQIQFYGAEIHRIRGSRDEVAEEARKFASQLYYASHSWNPFFFHGTKTFAYEICEQLGWRSPEAIVFPLGNGTFLLGSYMGFSELREMGMIEDIPRLIGVQSSVCNPLARVFRENLVELPEIEARKTIADGISVARPVRWKQILRAVRETGGEIISVEEEEILEALKELGRNGLYVEPTSAVALAGVRRMEDQGEILLPLTGSGLKLGERMKELLH